MSDLDLTEIDVMLSIAADYATYSRQAGAVDEMAAMASLSRAYSALASTHLQRLAAIHADEQARLQGKRWDALSGGGGCDVE